MILSVSRRTDIPAHYSDWFFNRLEAGYACTRNPMNFRQVSRIVIAPAVVDGFVFWTKNPTPMVDRLHRLAEYPYYFQFTLNAYGKDLEPGLPGKQEVLVPAFQSLSRQIGPERVIWRYDPIVLTDAYTLEHHIRYFDALAKRLSGFTQRCIISFVDQYRHLGSRFRPLGTTEIEILAEHFSGIALQYGLTLETCAEAVDLSRFGIGHGHCIDGRLFEQLLNQPLNLSKDKNQRPACGCTASIDLGMYDCCPSSCRYCYANHSQTAVRRNILAHDPQSPLLYGQISPEDTVRDRTMISHKITQLNLFEGEEHRHDQL